jgi:hypothetical protein
MCCAFAIQLQQAMHFIAESAVLRPNRRALLLAAFTPMQALRKRATPSGHDNHDPAGDTLED